MIKIYLPENLVVIAGGEIPTVLAWLFYLVMTFSHPVRLLLPARMIVCIQWALKKKT